MELNENCFALIKQMIDSNLFKHGQKMDVKNHLALTSDINSALLPCMIFWDPICYEYNKYQCMVCPLCFQDGHSNSFLVTIQDWEFGQTNSMIPRTIWDFNWYVALVGRRYKCSLNHSVVSYHAGILQQMESSHIPFLLSHNSGMTRETFDMFCRLINNGNTFSAAENIFAEQLIDKFYNCVMSLNIPDIPDINSFFKTLSPSCDFIRKCYLQFYIECKSIYQQEMSKINFEFLSMDYTFKTATNIGYMVSGKWKKLYDSLFLVLNERGQVLVYTFCLGTSFDHVSDLLESLRSRSSLPKQVYVDNCCNWRQKIMEVFPETEVKGDLFHGIQRLTKTIPKRHVFSSEACKELSLVFRSCGDFGANRTMITPKPKDIIKNMDLFLSKWWGVEYQGWKLISTTFSNAWKKLKCHIEKGCYSDIPIGHGANRSENIHKQLRTMLPRNRLGVDTAHSLFNAVFYNHNTRKGGSKYVLPIWRLKNTVNILDSSATNVEPQNWNILPFYDDLPIEKPGDHSYYGQNLSRATINGLNLANVFSLMDERFGKELVSRLFGRQEYTTMASTVWNPGSYLQLCRKTTVTDDFTISAVLEKLNLIEKFYYGCDSYGLLEAICVFLLDSRFSSKHSEFLTYLSESGVGISNLVEISIGVKRLLLDEISKNESLYEDLTMTDNLEELICSFEKNGKINENFFGCLLQAAASLINVIIVVIPRCYGLSFLPIVPTNGVAMKHVFYLCYNPTDSCFTVLVENDTEMVKCSCGKKDKIPKPRCKSDPRCSCFKKDVGCNQHCSCKCCQNGGGEKIKNDFNGKRRKRIPPSLSKSESLSSYTTAVIPEDIPSDLSTNRCQHFLLEAILFQYLRDVKLDFGDFTVEMHCQYLLDEYTKMVAETENTPIEWNALVLKRISLDQVSKWVKTRSKYEILSTEIKKNCSNEQFSVVK